MTQTRGIFGCADCWYFGATCPEWEGRWFCALDKDFEKPLLPSTGVGCFMTQNNGDRAWLSMYDKPSSKGRSKA